MIVNVAEGNCSKDSRTIVHMAPGLTSSFKSKNKHNKRFLSVKDKNKNRSVSINKNRDWKYVGHVEMGTFEPHMGIGEMVMGLNALNYVKDNMPLSWAIKSRLIGEVETMVALATTIARLEMDPIGTSAALFLYLRTRYKESLVQMVHDYLVDVLCVKKPHDGEEGGEKPSWIQFIRNINDNWRLCRSNKLFSQFSKFMGVLVTMNLCDASSVTFSVKEYTVFEPSLEVIHGNASDVMDAALSTVTFFVESMYSCFKVGSLMPLLMGDSQLADMDAEYTTLISWWDLVKNGNLYKLHKVSDAEFDRRVRKLGDQITKLQTCFKGYERKLLGDKRAKLATIITDYDTMKLSCGVRRAPFCIEFFGQSSQGKTTCAEQIIQVLLASAQLPIDKSYWASFNPSDKYMSNWKTDKMVLQFDDVSNTKPNFVEVAPTQAIIDICNNQPYYANMADLSSKGKIFVEPVIVTATTNIKHLEAYTYSNCPYSIQRRFHAVITVRVKDEFQRMIGGKPQGLDPNKVAQYYNDKTELKDSVFDDIWLLTVERAVQPECLTTTASYEVLRHNGVDLKDVSMLTVVNYLIDEFAKHRLAQDYIVGNLHRRNKNIVKCAHDGCFYIQGLCPVHECKPSSTEQGEIPRDFYFLEPEEERILMHEQSARIGGVPYLDVDPEEMSDIEYAKFMSSGYAPHFGDEIVNLVADVPGRISNLLSEQSQRVEANIVKSLISSGSYAASKTDIVQWLPTWMVHNEIVQKWYCWHRAESINRLYFKLSVKLLAYSLMAWLIGILVCDMMFGGSSLLFPLICITYALIQADLCDYVENKMVCELINRNSLFESDYFHRHKQKFICIETVCVVFLSFVLPLFMSWDNVWELFTCFMSCASVATCIHVMFWKYVERKDRLDTFKHETFAPAMAKLRDDSVKYVLSTCLLIGSLYTMAKLYKYWKSFQPQGSLSPTTREEIEIRDKEVNVWTGVSIRPLPISELSKTVSHDVLVQEVEKHLMYGSVLMGDKKMMVNALFVDSNLVIVPDHYFTQSEVEVIFRRSNPDDNGGIFKDRLSVVNSVLIPDTDLRLCYVYSGGTFRNLIKHFPVDHMHDHPFTMVYRDRNGDIIHAKGYAQAGWTNHSLKKFIGGEYLKLSTETFRGLCGAALVSDTRGCVISGFHLGGSEGTPYGCYGSLTQAQLKTAVDELRAKGLVKTGSSGIFPKEVYGVPLLTNKNLHYKSPLNFLPHGSQIMYHGSCLGQVTSYTGFKITPISQYVTEVMGVPNIWQAPKMKPEYYGWQKCLANMSLPGDSFPAHLLALAREDYICDLRRIIIRDEYADIRPLSDQANLKGLPGVKFIDAIKLGTSIGFPLGGDKRKHVEILGDEVMDFKPHIWEEINRCLESYKRGERAYPIAKAVKKDEVVSKEKCRIFYGNPISLTFLIRRYFLPIIRFLQLNPLISECAVGINSHGPEWEQLHQFVLKNSNEKRERIIGGDYGKYDQKLPCQLIITAFSILIELAKLRGYSSEDLNIMEAMVGDIVYAVIAYNGDLISLTSGSHISGNSLTVIINGICGSLNARLYWYSLGKSTNFRNGVSFMTYGDDNIGSVSENHVDFNIVGMSQFLAKYGQEYTMPDKTSDMLPFLKFDQLEFLKRSSNYIPELGVHVGALNEKSIYKSLHCYIRTKGTPLTESQLSALNIDGALREWFNHGRVVYEDRQEKLIKVANLSGISHMCAELELSYDDRLTRWKNTYA